MRKMYEKRKVEKVKCKNKIKNHDGTKNHKTINYEVICNSLSSLLIVSAFCVANKSYLILFYFYIITYVA